MDHGLKGLGSEAETLAQLSSQTRLDPNEEEMDLGKTEGPEHRSGGAVLTAKEG